MCGPDVFRQVGAAGELQLTLIPAARVAQRLAPRWCRAIPHHGATAVAVEHGGGGAAAGRCALHVHQGAADTATRTRQNKDTVMAERRADAN